MQLLVLELLPRLLLRGSRWMPRATSTPRGGNRTLPKSVLSGESDPTIHGSQLDLYGTLRLVIHRELHLTVPAIFTSLTGLPAEEFGKWLLMRLVVQLTILRTRLVQPSPTLASTAQAYRLRPEFRELMDSRLINPAISGPAM